MMLYFADRGVHSSILFLTLGGAGPVLLVQEPGRNLESGLWA